MEYEEYVDKCRAGVPAAEIWGTSRSEAYVRIAARGWPTPRKAKVDTGRAAWVADYDMLIDEGLSNGEIMNRMRLTSDAFYKNLSRWGCRRLTRDQSRVRSLIDVWVARGDRFTMFDMPDGVDSREAFSVVDSALKSGEIVRFGKVRFPWNPGYDYWSFGSPSSSARVPTLTELRSGDLRGSLSGVGA